MLSPTGTRLADPPTMSRSDRPVRSASSAHQAASTPARAKVLPRIGAMAAATSAGRRMAVRRVAGRANSVMTEKAEETVSGR